MFFEERSLLSLGGGLFLRGLDGGSFLGFRPSLGGGLLWKNRFFRFLSHNSFGKLRKSEKLVTHTIESHFGPKKLKKSKKVGFSKKCHRVWGSFIPPFEFWGGVFYNDQWGENISSSINVLETYQNSKVSISCFGEICTP